MSIKDKVFKWFFVNVIQPKIFQIDTPGILHGNYPTSEKALFRAIIMPESFYVDLENRMAEEGKEEVLYRAGKQGGWSQAKALRMKNLEENSKDEVKNSLSPFHRYIEFMWAGKLDYEIELEDKKYRAEAENWSICRKNGKGHIFSEGAIGGVIAYVLQDRTVECVHTTCQGRGDEKCVMKSMSRKKFETNIKTGDPEDIGFSEKYFEFNKKRNPEFATNSLQDLINDNIIKHTKGKILWKNERMIWAQIHYLYYIEWFMQKNDMEDLLFDVAFETGKNIAGGRKDLSFLPDFVSALGWGDIYPRSRKEIKIGRYPWVDVAEELEFNMIRGLVSGVVSSVEDDEIKFRDFEAKEEEDLSLTLYSK